MIKEEDLIIDIYSVAEDMLGEFHKVKITHRPTGEFMECGDRSIREARCRALAELTEMLEQIENWERIADKSSPLCTQSQRDLPEIITHADEKGELCYRTHYIDPDRNAAHKIFMNDNGWVNNGECMFNSGNGHLYIYRSKK